MDMSLSELQELVMDREACRAVILWNHIEKHTIYVSKLFKNHLPQEEGEKKKKKRTEKTETLKLKKKKKRKNHVMRS